MKRKITSLTTAIIVLFLILFTLPETVVGQTYTQITQLDMTNAAYGTSSYSSDLEYTSNSLIWHIVNGANNNKGWTYFKMGGKSATIANYNPCYIYSPQISEKVDKVTVHLPSGSLSKNGMSVNSWALCVYSSSTMNGNNRIDSIAGGTITNSEGTFNFTPSTNVTWAANYYYKVTWNLANTTTTNGIVCVDKITLYKVAANTITAQSNNTDYGTVSLDGTVITGAPKTGCRYANPAYTVNPANSATVVQNGNAFTVTATANTTVTINFEEIPSHTATFSVNGTTSSQDYYEGATITFPDNPENIYGKTFVGWTTTAIEGTTNTAPGFVNTSETTMGTAAITYYAVFADMTGSASPTLTKMTSEDTFVANDKVVIVASGTVAMYQETTTSPTNYVNKWSFDNNAATVAADNKKMFTVSAGSSTGTWKLGDATNGYVYNSSSNDLKIDKDNSTNFTLAWNSIVNQVEINKFTLIGNDRWLSYRSDLNNNYFRMGGATSGTAAGTVYFDIYKYSTGSVSYINYCTTVTPPAVEIPEIVITSNPFLFSTTVTITCGTEGSSIKYRYNENDSWSDYTAALTITETKTIYAKGVKGNDESLVAQATATKNLATPTVTVSGDITLDLDGETSVAAGTLTADVTYNNAAVEGATVTWESNHTDIATIDASTGAVTLLTTGEVTFTATYAGNNDYAEATGTKTVTVVNSKAPGTAGNPYTVAQALSVINALNDNGTAPGKYVKGIISYVGDYNGTYSSINYYISDDGTVSDELYIYSGKGIAGAGFTTSNDLKVSDKVVVFGTLKKYVKNSTTTPEFDKNSQIYSLIRPGTGGNPATIAGTFNNFDIANDESYAVAANTIFIVTGTLTVGPTANLIIEDGAQLICDNSVAATFKKTMPTPAAPSTKDEPEDVYGWELISSPVHDGNIDGTNAEIAVGHIENLITDPATNYDMFSYDEEASMWRNQKAGSGASGFTTLSNGQGYMYRNNAQELSFVGNTNVNDVEVSLTYTAGAGDLAGFHLVGNPYTENITLMNTTLYNGTTQLDNDKQLSAYYVLENNGSSWKTDLAANTPIANKQGFLIEIPSTANKIKFSRTARGSAKYHNDNIKFMVANSQFEDVTYALFDKALPLNKINHRNPEVPMIYINQNDQDYAVATMTDDTKAFNLNFKAATAGKYTLSYKATGDYNYLHVIDRLTGEDVDMLLEGEYSFIGTPKDSENRFIVRLEYMPNYGEEGNDIFAYQSGSDIYVSGQGELQVFDVTGRRVMTTTINGAESISIPAQGVYIFKLNEKVQKIVVR